MRAAARFKVFVATAAVLLIGCGGGGKAGAEVLSIKDRRDGKIYKTVKIGTQTWMAENLNYAAEGSKCYDNNADNCAKYGRLYNWSTATGVCPAGWHLPSDAEWITLEDAVGGRDIAGEKLKSTAGWNNNGNGTDEYGVSALPGGYGYSDGSFKTVGYHGYWWSATQYDASYAWFRYMICNHEYLYSNYYDKTDLFSVRCVEDQ